MIGWRGLLGAISLLLMPLGSASAASLFDISISYISSTSFTLSDLSFSSPLTTNVFAGSPYVGGQFVAANPSVTPVTLVSVIAPLNTTDPFTFHFDVTPTGGTKNVFNETLSVIGASQGIGATSFAGLTFYAVSVGVSSVPLPASFPLFALALICLAAFGYHTRRKAVRLAPKSDGINFA
jgi:hypothetical protein